MASHQVFLAAVTVSELRYGALVAGWGQARTPQSAPSDRGRSELRSSRVSVREVHTLTAGSRFGTLRSARVRYLLGAQLVRSVLIADIAG